MSELFATGRIVDLIIGLMVLEAVGLWFLRRRTGRGPLPLGLLVNLAAGGCLLLALRLALVDAGWLWVGAALGLAFVAHLADLIVRWRA